MRNRGCRQGQIARAARGARRDARDVALVAVTKQHCDEEVGPLIAAVCRLWRESVAKLRRNGSAYCSPRSAAA
jgi:uncharacterized pyridoxal phosphate-containing UPF0001 family protein